MIQLWKKFDTILKEYIAVRVKIDADKKYNEAGGDSG